MISKIQSFFHFYWEEKPLTLIVFLAILFRLLAVVFAKGFGMYDDQYFVVEVAQSWVDGNDYYQWLPSSGNIQIMGHLYLYPCLHYLLFYGFKIFGIANPQLKMLVVRFIHALLSMIIVVFGYRIAKHYGGLKSAREAGLLLAIFFFMPFLSVHSLFETACIPFLIFGMWQLIKTEINQNLKSAIIAGVCFAFAFAFRLQVAFFFAGLGLALLFTKKWKQILGVLIGFVLATAVIQLCTDVLIFGKPFVQLQKYIAYNMSNAETFGVKPWYNYLLFTFGILIPPMSVLLMAGFFVNIKKQLILFLPVLLFFIFHSYFPNKQERFILTIFPFLIIAGVCGWNELIETQKSIFFRRFKKIAWVVFFILNTIPLFVISATYSKRSLVEAMTYLYQQKNAGAIVCEHSTNSAYYFLPVFYSGKWKENYMVASEVKLSDLKAQINQQTNENYPTHVIFFEETNLTQRVDSFKKYFPGIAYQTTIQPGFVDKLLHQLNPANANFEAVVYKFPEREKH